MKHKAQVLNKAKGQEAKGSVGYEVPRSVSLRKTRETRTKVQGLVPRQVR